MGITGGLNMITPTPTAGVWFGNKNVATGESLLSCVPRYALILALLASPGTGGMNDDLSLLQHAQKESKTMLRPLQIYSHARTPSENIARIREIFSTAVSDLAKVFNVSRQTIYNWLNGEQPVTSHIDKINDLAMAADMFAGTSLPVTSTLLKRKIIQGKSFLEVVHEGGSAQDTAFLLKQIVLNEMDQRNMLKLRFAGRKTSTKSADTDLIAENDAV